MHNRLAQLREERANGERGFTLIELLVVVVIIGILIAIAIPLYLNYTKGANDKSADSDVRGAVATLEQCNSDNGSYPSSLSANTNASNVVTSYTACTGQTINVSNGTTMKYFTTTGGYVLVGENGNGQKNDYCYNSTKGGSITKVTITGGIANASASSC